METTAAAPIPLGSPDKRPDVRPLATVLVSLVLFLLLLGVGVLGSASGEIGRVEYKGDAMGFLKRQVIFSGLGAVAMLACAYIDYRIWRFLRWVIAVVVCGLLVWALNGKVVNGSQRWIDLKAFQVQPSELAKIALVVIVASHLDRYRNRMGEILTGMALPLAALGVFCGLIFIEPDYGTTLLLAVVALLLLYLGGARLGPLLVVGTAGATLFLIMVLQDTVRTRRIVAFLNPERYKDQEGFQQLAAAHAFIFGGATGTGFGQGMQKQNYLPEAHTDFIFAIMGEELGITATLAVLGVFLAIFFIGLRIASVAFDTYGRMLATGITLLFTFQALINMAVVTGLMPNKGLPLPFISYGGSSLMASAAMVGILVNIARVASDERLQQVKNPIKDRLTYL
jgi:cell division protein FtsW